MREQRNKLKEVRSEYKTAERELKNAQQELETTQNDLKDAQSFEEGATMRTKPQRTEARLIAQRALDEAQRNLQEKTDNQNRFTVLIRDLKDAIRANHDDATGVDRGIVRDSVSDSDDDSADGLVPHQDKKQRITKGGGTPREDLSFLDDFSPLSMSDLDGLLEDKEDDSPPTPEADRLWDKENNNYSILLDILHKSSNKIIQDLKESSIEKHIEYMSSKIEEEIQKEIEDYLEENKIKISEEKKPDVVQEIKSKYDWVDKKGNKVLEWGITEENLKTILDAARETAPVSLAQGIEVTQKPLKDNISPTGVDAFPGMQPDITALLSIQADAGKTKKSNTKKKKKKKKKKKDKKKETKKPNKKKKGKKKKETKKKPKKNKTRKQKK